MGFWKMAAGGAVILGLLENFRELHRFRTTEYDIRSEKMRGEARVLFLSDLHNHRYGFRNRRLVEAVRRAIEAKRKGEIDDFVFYDVSLDYLAASLQTL